MNENPQSTPPQPEPPGKQKRITIDLPKNLAAVYSNVAFMRYTPAEILIDFAQVLPGTPRGQVLSRIIMSPMHAKMLQRALADNIAKYERQFGEIRLPIPLADQFFRFPRQEDENNE